MGLYLPGLARRGVAVLRLRGVLGEASACRFAASLRWAFAADPDLLITDVGGQMVLTAAGAHLRRTEPAEAVVFDGCRDGEGPAAVVCCDVLNFFAGRATAEQWVREHPEVTRLLDILRSSARR